jgi:hypothetical protein
MNGSSFDYRQVSSHTRPDVARQRQWFDIRDLLIPVDEEDKLREALDLASQCDHADAVLVTGLLCGVTSFAEARAGFLGMSR